MNTVNILIQPTHEILVPISLVEQQRLRPVSVNAQTSPEPLLYRYMEYGCRSRLGIKFRSYNHQHRSIKEAFVHSRKVPKSHFQAQLLIIFVDQTFIWKLMVKKGHTDRQ